VTQYILPVLYVIFLWWFSTGAILWLSTRSKRNLPASLLLMTVLAAAGFAGATMAANTNQSWAPYLGFVAALAIWGWIEFTFLTGLITGPRTKSCPSNISENQRFKLAFLTLSHHEFSLVGALMAVFLVTYSGDDQTAFWTFLTLWLMRISAKLSIFSGVPSFCKEMMPASLSHLHSYIRDDRIGPVFWISTGATTIILITAVLLLMNGLVPQQTTTIAVMLTSLVGLAAFEHWMMVLPVKETVLWRWAISDQSRPSTYK